MCRFAAVHAARDGQTAHEPPDTQAFNRLHPPPAVQAVS